jgi:hypothetical protein
MSARHWLALGLAVALVASVVGLQFVGRAPAAPPATGALYLVDQSTLLALRGDVQLQRVGATAYEPLTGQVPIQVGDRVRTGADGYAALVYFDGSTSSIAPDTELVLQRFERDPSTGATAVIVQQPLGSSWTVAADGGHPFSGFLLVSSAGRFFGRGSQFSATVAPEGTTLVTTQEGSIFGRANNADVEVPAGFSTRVFVGDPPEPPVPAALPPVTLQVRVDGPVRALLTDARGRSVGYHPQAEASVSQIPEARLTSGDGGAQVFSVPGPVETYNLTLRGTGGGEVSVAVGTLRAGERSAPAAALVAAAIGTGETQVTSFQWQDNQVRELQALAPAAGPPPDSAVALLRNPPPPVAMVATSPPLEATSSGDDPEGEARSALVEPDAADVFSSFEAPTALQRPAVVAPSVPNRPVVSAPPPPPAPPRPAVVAQAPRPPGSAATAVDLDDPPTPSPAPPPPTVRVQVVTATPLPPTPVPPTPIPPTPRPPTPVPPTPEPTVPPPLPTPVPTSPPTRATGPRPTTAPNRGAIAPTATPISITVVPGGLPRQP